VSSIIRSKPSRWLILVVIAFLALSIGYSYTFPMFEGFDETSHYRLVDYYARHWSMPDLAHAPSHEAHQPPLYYVVGAVLVSPIDRSDFDRVFQLNPGEDINVRQNLAVTDMSLFPRGTTLAVRVLRLFSALLGAATVVLAYAMTRQLGLPDKTALLSAALLAFNPKFIMLSASVSNDIATVCLAALCLALSATIMRRAPSIRRIFVLGVAVGLAALSKYSGLALGLPAVFAVLWSVFVHSERRSALQRLVVCGIALGGGVLLTCGWLFVVRWVQYGNPLAWEQVSSLNLFALRPTPLSFTELISKVPALLPTTWRVNPGLPEQKIGDVIAWGALILAVIGWVIGIRRKALPATTWILPIAILGSIIALFPWIRAYRGAEDSRLLPAVFCSLAVLVGAGITALTPSHAGRWLATGLAVISFVWAARVPAALIQPLFPPLAPLSEAKYIYQLPAPEVDALPQAGMARFDNGLELVSATIQNDRLSPGEDARLSIIWRTVHPPIHTYALTLEAFDAQGKSLGKWDGLPLNGQRVTYLWQIGDIYQDNYRVPISVTEGAQPTVVSIYAGWHDAAPPYPMAGISGSTAVSMLVGKVKVRASQPITATAQHSIDAQFGGMIGLEGYDLTGDTLTLHWRALDHITADYQVFVHALDAKGNLIAQSDGPLPYGSSLWDTQELVLDTRTLKGLSSAATVQVGLYHLADGARLEARKADASAWPDNSVVLWQSKAP
jgi:4-amino-4-deoxy-L-arabinose transferase-like glycosyltransferase